ncbi:MAG: hypothetical protein M3416_13475, partial [Acidobacteriota bacterium]|nr:hypothetical protein [Acidobacteriota bacterium]
MRHTLPRRCLALVLLLSSAGVSLAQDPRPDGPGQAATRAETASVAAGANDLKKTSPDAAPSATPE